MVVLIFEGADNLGKSTIIQKLVDKYKNVADIMLMHASAPKCKEGENPDEVQKETFKQAVIKCSTIAIQDVALKRSNSTIVFMDRSHIGEYVYGQIYRNGDPDKIFDMIYEVHNKNLYFNPVVVHLEASPEFVIAHDDNKSFTSGYEPEKRMQTVTREIELFNEIIERLKPNKYMKINVEAADNNYRNIDDICNEILSKLKEMNIELI